MCNNRRISLAALAVASAFAPYAFAQGAADQPQQLEKVIVTGEKTERSLEDTAASVHVIDQRALTENPSLSTTDNVLEGIPNITTSGTSNFAPAVRGVDGTGPAQGVDAFFAGTRPRLGLQLDGRAANYNEVIFGNFSTWDVQQVEVFRGAQSLLQGRNTIAGTVVVKTNDPSFEREIGARAMVGNYGQRQYAAVLNAPLLADEVAFRVAVDRQLSESGTHGFAGYAGVGDPGEYESDTVRAKLLVQPKALPGFSTLVTLAHTDHVGPQTDFVGRPFSDRTVPAAYARMETFTTRTNSVVADTTWRLSPLVSLENRLSFADSHVKRTAAVPGLGEAAIDGTEWTLEPRVRFTGTDTNGFVGLYLARAKQDEWLDLSGIAFLGDVGTFDDKSTSAAVYGEITHALRTDLQLTLGARYERERKDRSGSLATGVVDIDETYTAFLPKAVLTWKAADDLAIGAGVSRGHNGGGGGVTFAAPFEIYEFDEEYVWNYEAFLRADMLGGKLQLTGNLFYSRYKDMQLPFDINPDPNQWAYVIRNADRADTYGAEFGVRWLPVRNLRLNADIGLLKTKIKEFNNPEIEGNDLARSPALTANFGVHYRHASGIEFGANARYSESYYSDVLNLSRGKVDPYWIVNTRLAYNFDAYRIFAFVTNVFDEDAPILISADSFGGPASDTANLTAPRMAGVGVEAWF